MRLSRVGGAVAIVTAFVVMPVRAQTESPSGSSDAPAQTPQAQEPPAVPIYPGGVAPPPPGMPVGGGNATESSARPLTGDEQDTFDLRPSSRGSSTTLRGNQAGPVFLQPGHLPSSHVTGTLKAPFHDVQKGDTLWDVSGKYLDSPYAWPRLWSYNPQVKNPHWIFPGDRIVLQGKGVAAEPTATGLAGAGKSLVERRRGVPLGTVFLRDQAYISEGEERGWGEVGGAPEDKMFLADTDDVYVTLRDGHDIRPGSELSVFRPIREVGKGSIVQIQATVRVQSWEPSRRVAKARVIETLDVVERGAKVGPVERRFAVVLPVTNTVDLRASVLASIHPQEYYCQDQIVFVDKGQAEGLKVGNRLFVVHKGDAWFESLATPSAATRIAIESSSPAEIEYVPRSPSEKHFPEEVIGEARVVAVREHTATCLVTQSTREVEGADRVVVRKGY